MPFKNQIRPDVPNQMGLSTPQNAQGLGMPGGQAMFNLSRFQMPGGLQGGENQPVGSPRQLPAQQPLKQRMMGSGGYGENGFTGQKPTSQLSNLGFESQIPGNQGVESALPGWQGYGGGDAAQLGYPSQSPFGMLRNRMLAQPGSMVFI